MVLQTSSCRPLPDTHTYTRTCTHIHTHAHIWHACTHALLSLMRGKVITEEMVPAPRNPKWFTFLAPSVSLPAPTFLALLSSYKHMPCRFHVCSPTLPLRSKSHSRACLPSHHQVLLGVLNIASRKAPSRQWKGLWLWDLTCGSVTPQGASEAITFPPEAQPSRPVTLSPFPAGFGAALDTAGRIPERGPVGTVHISGEMV